MIALSSQLPRLLITDYALLLNKSGRSRSKEIEPQGGKQDARGGALKIGAPHERDEAA
jgi:hypothetical protein